MALSEQDVSNALKTVVDPLTGQDFVTSKSVKNLQIKGGDVSFEVELGYPAKSLWAAFEQQLQNGSGPRRDLCESQSHKQSHCPCSSARRGAVAAGVDHHRRASTGVFMEDFGRIEFHTEAVFMEGEFRFHGCAPRYCSVNALAIRTARRRACRYVWHPSIRRSQSSCA